MALCSCMGNVMIKRELIEALRECICIYEGVVKEYLS